MFVRVQGEMLRSRQNTFVVFSLERQPARRHVVGQRHYPAGRKAIKCTLARCRVRHVGSTMRRRKGDVDFFVHLIGNFLIVVSPRQMR